MGIVDYLERSEAAIEAARHHSAIERVDPAVEMIWQALSNEKPLLVCGNGGSASDAMHITGELVCRFYRDRRALNCLCLSSNPTVLTAWANDFDYQTIFARQVEAHGSANGVLIGLSTSGNSMNVVRAFEAARAMGMKTIALTGQGGGKLAPISDILIDVPSDLTPIVQQVHSCIYHYMCERIEALVAA